MHKPRTSLSISARRHFVDDFFFRQANLISGKDVADIGGKKTNKRGLFNADIFAKKVTYINIEEKDNPDILADATSIPLPDSTFDIVILGELLEHVPEPKLVIEEAKRLIKPEGKIIISVPFMVGVHGDPADYGRYTQAYWEKVAQDLLLNIEYIETQGNIFSVMALMLQHIFRAKNASWEPIQSFLVSFLMYLDRKTTHPLLKAWTTGYGFILTK